jgi:RNA polymerase sigma factor (sigma-70 family)
VKETVMSRLSSRTDAELIAATPGDRDAFAELYRRHERAVLRFFVHWCRSPELAADLTAETFAAAFAAVSRYEPDRGEPRPWLFGIARNILARSVKRGRVEDQTRRRLGMPALVIDDEALERIEALVSPNNNVLDALSELAEPIREAVSGRVLEEREYRELASALACSESVVRQRVSRGLARIRDRLEATE